MWNRMGPAPGAALAALPLLLELAVRGAKLALVPPRLLLRPPVVWCTLSALNVVVLLADCGRQQRRVAAAATEQAAAAKLAAKLGGAGLVAQKKVQ